MPVSPKARVVEGSAGSLSVGATLRARTRGLVLTEELPALPPTTRKAEPVTLPDQLRQLARRVELLAVSGRTDPESVVTEKQLISRALRRLAQQEEG